MAAPSDRQLRVFVSSTFQDMEAERRLLLGKVFPRVADFCHRRKWEFTGVDLRWGISEEQSRRGETAALCMAEIDHCRPLFIGMVGERYGWVPAGAQVSITEEEILYGALEAPADTEAFFYLRDSALTEKLCGSYEKDPRLDALKTRIRASRYPVMDGYRELESFAERVYEDLISAVERITDAAPEADPITARREDQRFLARHYTGSFVRRPALRQILVEAVEQGGLTLVTGPSGSGKTALLSEWALSHMDGDEGYTFLYYVGSSADRGWEAVARQLNGELNGYYGWGDTLPEGREALRRALAASLHMAASRGRLTLAIDRIDALTLDDGFGLSWLPEELPEGVSVVLTVSDGEVLDRLRLRRHRELAMEPLSSREAADIAVRFLAAHSKTLSRSQLALLHRSPRTQNPRFLLTVLNETLHVGHHSTLTDQLRDYLACESVDALFEKVLCRMDRDYGEDGLCRELFTLLEASRDGLTETELISLLGDIPYARFAPLYFALEPYTAVSNGALHLSAPEFRRSVTRHYGMEAGMLEHKRGELTDWFLAHGDTPRRVYVLPWLLRETGRWEALFDLLSEPESMSALWEQNRYELCSLWSELRQREYSPVEGYSRILYSPADYSPALRLETAELFLSLGETEKAKTLLSSCIRQQDSEGEEQRGLALGLLGNLLQRQGQLREAERCYEEKYELSARLHNAYEQQRSLGNLGLIRLAQGNLSAARESFEGVYRLSLTLNQRDSQQVALGNLGSIAFQQGDLDRAGELFERQRIISTDSGNIPGIINAEGALGLVYLKENRLSEAEAAFARQEEQSRRLGAYDGLANALGNLSVLAQHRGDDGRAEELLREKLSLCRRTGQFSGEQNALGNLAALCARQNRREEALAYAEERVALTKRGAALRQYAQALLQLAELERLAGRLTEAHQHELMAKAVAKQHGFSL